MRCIEFEGQNVVFAKDQPEYNRLPARRFNDAEGRIAFCWQLSLVERLRVLVSGRLWHQVLTFDKPLQPQLLALDRPFEVTP